MTGDGQGSRTGAGTGTYRRVVVGVDDSAGGLAALRYAVGMASAGHSQLVAVRSWDLGLPRHGGRRHRHRSHQGVLLLYNGVQQRIESRNLISRVFQAAAGGIPDDVAVTVKTPEGDPGEVLSRIAGAAGDVLVVGTEPGHLVRRLMHGSVSRYCLTRARCPVMVVSASAPAPVTGPGAVAPLTAHTGSLR